MHPMITHRRTHPTAIIYKTFCYICMLFGKLYGILYFKPMIDINVNIPAYSADTFLEREIFLVNFE